MQALEEYRKPRDALLILVSDFIRICAPRLEELEEASLPPRYTVPELLDHISVNVRVVYSSFNKTCIPLNYAGAVDFPSCCNNLSYSMQREL